MFGTSGRGTIWLKAAFATLFLGIFAASRVYGAAPSDSGHWVRPADEPSGAPAPDLAQPCLDAGTTPVCALKTYLACVLYDAPNLCALVGFADVPERYPGRDTLDDVVLDAPWSASFERLMPEAFALHIYDGGPVPAARFQTSAFEQIPAYTSGAFEIVVDIPEPYVDGLVYRQSVFFREKPGGSGGSWRIIAWSSSRAAACDDKAGTASWGPCRWFLKDLRQRDVFAKDVKQIWASPREPGRDDYPHPGLEIMSGLPNQPVVAPFAGTVVRRSLKYPDVPLYDWVIIQGEKRQANMMAKFVLVDRTGPSPGQHVDAAVPLGRPQWVESEHPGAGRFIHLELLRNGYQIDPRTVMRERRAQ
jgi:hypothetical protein